jgi:hypothetical protein
VIDDCIGTHGLATLQAYQAELLQPFQPKPHWSTASRSLVSRLRGIYSLGPEADQGIGEFGTREFTGLPPIQFEAAARIGDLEETLAKVQEILFAYGEANEATAHPWWGIVRRAGLGRYDLMSGPFFSREAAEELRSVRIYHYGEKSLVYCFSGHESWQYKELRGLFKKGDR